MDRVETDAANEVEAMDVDDIDNSVVDLSIGSSSRREPHNAPVNSNNNASSALVDQNVNCASSPSLENNLSESKNIQSSARGILLTKNNENGRPKRNLRPRIERSYAESPDEPKLNGYVNGNASDSDDDDDDCEMPPMPPIKELSREELAEREKKFRKLREELRSEEMKLVLLKKLKQSQQIKENIAQQVKTPKMAGPPSQPAPAHMQRPSKGPPPLLRGQQSFNRGSNLHAAPPGILLPPSVSRNSTSSTGMPPNMVIPQPPHPRVRTSSNTTVSYHALSDRTERSTKDPSPSPGHQLVGPQDNKPAVPHKTPVIPDQERSREDAQTPAQRQAAAKQALRKQLEKTLLQIPPPKPPPPEMHFVPSPANPEFIYLVGLEHVVDFITKEPAIPPPPEPFECTQCKTDFTPVWKWEKPAGGNKKDGQQGHATFQKPSVARDPRVICEHCVTTNVKKALKAEHTNRLKTAFVKALKQEKEIDERLAQAACPSPDPPMITITKTIAKAPTPTRRTVTPPTQPQQLQILQQAPTPPSSKGLQDHPLVKLAESGKFPHPVATAAAIQQQLIRELSKNPVAGLSPHQPLPAHMMPPFNPLLYPYQLAMAQAAGGKGLAELQRQAADLQRQYLLDMIPSQVPGQSQSNQSASRVHPHNWKT